MRTKTRIRFDEITITSYHWSGPEKAGSLGWDSATGEVWGTLAAKVTDKACQAKQEGSWNTIHPIPGGFHVRITDPMHDPGEIAVILESLGFYVPEVLAPFFERITRRQRRAQERFYREARARGEDVVY
jgi:hypothetical protein